MLRVLAVDDELPALEELAYLLRGDPRVGAVHTASGAAAALRVLDAERVDALFLDIKMPGLDGLDLARALGQFAAPPVVVFVTAYDDFAVGAFDLQAVDYVLKPVRMERLGEAVRRVSEAVDGGVPREAPDADETVAVELAGVTRFVPRSDVRYVEAAGDYARLHTARGNHLIRVPLAVLEERWRRAGFVRIHRSHLVALRHVQELRLDGGRLTVRVGDDLLPVSRRHTRQLRDLLLGRKGGSGEG
ncbi:MAG: LytR/AlgR family response regulator transcription factor [Carbonactinosporaceae bacterium]